MKRSVRNKKKQIRKERSMYKIVKYEVKLLVPQSQGFLHQNKFESILLTAINKGLKGKLIW